jgi:hypothetical protein
MTRSPDTVVVDRVAGERAGDAGFPLIDDVVRYRHTSEAVLTGHQPRRQWRLARLVGFPVEQHFLLPCVHWFSKAVMTWLVWNLRRDLRSYGWEGVRVNVTYTKPLSMSELRRLFPGARTWTEWFVVFPKKPLGAVVTGIAAFK